VSTPQHVSEIVRRAEQTLRLAELGLADLRGQDPDRRIPGLSNVVVFGRAVTFVLQNLSGSIGAEFHEWYEPVKADLEADPLMVFWKHLRNEIEKHGRTPEMGRTITVQHGDFRDLSPILQDPPPGAEGFFMGDALGGSGWKVRLPDGSEETYYVALPEQVQMTIDLFMPQAPAEHKGQPISDTSLAELAQLYIERLREVIQSAKRAFGLPL
jgi:hypothetical protein